MALPPSIQSFVIELCSQVVATVVDKILERLPEIATAWRTANTDTLKDAAVDPSLDAALRKEQADAIAKGKLPPPP